MSRPNMKGSLFEDKLPKRSRWYVQLFISVFKKGLRQAEIRHAGRDRFAYCRARSICCDNRIAPHRTAVRKHNFTDERAKPDASVIEDKLNAGIFFRLVH